MMKLLIPVLALVVIVSSALPVLASDAAGPRDVSGTIKKVDTVSNTVTVQTAEMRENTFTVDSGTKITVGGKEGSLADLKEGQSAKLKVDGSKALSIEV